MHNINSEFIIEKKSDSVYKVTRGENSFYVTPTESSCFDCSFSLFIDSKLHCILREDASKCDCSFSYCTEDGLKPCPCCGTEPTLYYGIQETHSFITAACPSCGLAITRLVDISDKSDIPLKCTELKDAWNTRVRKFNYDTSSKEFLAMDHPLVNEDSNDNEI